jgi:hypothetical protein
MTDILPENLISYCPELSVWRLTETGTGRSKVITPDDLAKRLKSIRHLFEKAK